MACCHLGQGRPEVVGVPEPYGSPGLHAGQAARPPGFARVAVVSDSYTGTGSQFAL